MKWINKNKVNFTILFIGIVLIWISSNFNWYREHWRGIIEADGKGYYAYLPAMFIYHDLNFGFFDEIEKEKYYSENTYYDYRTYQNGCTLNKYYAGTALAMMPFFLAGHCYALLSDHPADGYSAPYAIFINLAAIFYLLIACIYMSKLLRLYNIKESIIILTIIAFVFGTNIFYYTVSEPAMSHIYSLAFISAFLYFSKRYFIKLCSKYMLTMAVLSGMIVLIRPVNLIIVAAVPFIAGSFQDLKAGITAKLRNTGTFVLSLMIIIIIFSLQFIIYKIQTGSFFIYSYKDEGFNFFDPHFTDFLFSYKKGLFIYTPLAFISLAGFIYLYRQSRYQFLTLAGFFIVLIYMLSSWWNWYYGGSFSSRVFIEYFVLLAILLGITLENIRNRYLKKAYILLVFLLIIACQIQTVQYRYFDIHWSEMTKEKYWDVFMRIDKLI